jgi:micrococcal nuclease
MPSYPVLRVLDGVTLLLTIDSKPRTVRLIGVDLPQVAGPSSSAGADPAKQAAQFLSKIVQGKSVYLEADPGQPRLDSTGKMAAYIYRAPDGLLLNQELISQGQGRASTRRDFRLYQAFQSAEQEAKTSQVGLWANSAAAASASKTTTKPQAGPAPTRSTQATVTGKTPKGEKAEEPETETVVVLRGSKKYHREGCRLVTKGASSITLAEAKDKKLEPCKVCKPDQPVTTTTAGKSKKKRYQSQAEQRKMLDQSLGTFDAGIGAGGGGGGAASPY